MKEPNPPSEEEHVRELDVDEAFEHWSDLAKRLGASNPGETWDQSSDRSPPAESRSLSPRKGEEEPSASAEAETDWNAVANSLGVSVTPDRAERELPARQGVPSPPREVRPAPASDFRDRDQPQQEVDPSLPQASGSNWNSIWGDEPEEPAPERPVPSEQAALDRMFGADSSRVFESEPDTRSEYFDISEEDDYAAEVRFAPRGQDPAPTEPGREREREREREGDDRGRRNRRGRRGQPRRRGRRPESRPSDAKDTREPLADSDEFPGEDDRSVDEDYEFARESQFDDADDTPQATRVAEEEDTEDAAQRPARHRKVASWKDAVGLIVDRNLANRDRDASDGNRRRRGGRRR